MGIHDGHRERLREHFLDKGVDGFTTVAALEFLLQFAIPRRDTNPIAHALLDTFGSLKDIFEASEQQLCQVPGVGPNAAALIMLVPQILRRSEIDKVTEFVTIPDRKTAREYLRPFFMNEQNEVAYLLCLDVQQRPTKCVEIGRGGVDGLIFDPRLAVELALKYMSSSVYIAHNHPLGPAKNSREDDLTTQQMMRLFQQLGIHLIDHFIYCPEGVFSYASCGALKLLEY